MYQRTLPPISNQATWKETLEFINDETGEPWFAQGQPPDEITLRLRDPASGSIVLGLSLAGGELEVVGDGLVQFTASAEQMAGIVAKSYEVGILFTAGDDVVQVLLGVVPVLKGL